MELDKKSLSMFGVTSVRDSGGPRSKSKQRRHNMGFVLIFGMLLVISIVGLVVANKQRCATEGWWCAIVCTGIVFFFVFAVGVLVNPVTVRSNIAEFHAVQQTLETARQNADISHLELAAIQREAVTANKWLANAKFWTEQWLTSWFWPSKDVLALQPIK